MGMKLAPAELALAALLLAAFCPVGPCLEVNHAPTQESAGPEDRGARIGIHRITRTTTTHLFTVTSTAVAFFTCSKIHRGYDYGRGLKLNLKRRAVLASVAPDEFQEPKILYSSQDDVETHPSRLIRSSLFEDEIQDKVISSTAHPAEDRENKMFTIVRHFSTTSTFTTVTTSTDYGQTVTLIYEDQAPDDAPLVPEC
ncbi:uncharacterized protein LOC134766370 [Penaeus indicus]|uniref:uncharacterized protein LOC134766370 n=1 Tax=Penaeus indicus TaxID=29960 RepID=UPI00300BFF26